MRKFQAQSVEAGYEQENLLFPNLCAQHAHYRNCYITGASGLLLGAVVEDVEYTRLVFLTGLMGDAGERQEPTLDSFPTPSHGSPVQNPMGQYRASSQPCVRIFRQIVHAGRNFSVPRNFGKA